MSELTCIDKLTGIESSCRLPRARPAKAIAVAAITLGLGVACALTAGPAMADTRVQGKPQAVSLQAQNATVEEILVALSNAFNVQFRSSADLDKRLSGTYEGTLPQVVSHILKGYDFVMKFGTAGLEITLLGSGKAMKIVGAAEMPKRRPDAAIIAAGAALPMPAATSNGLMPIIKAAEGQASVPVPVMPPSGAAPVPIPRKGTGPMPAPTPPAPGAAATPVPAMPPSGLPPASAAAAPPAMQPSPTAASPLDPSSDRARPTCTRCAVLP